MSHPSRLGRAHRHSLRLSEEARQYAVARQYPGGHGRLESSPRSPLPPGAELRGPGLRRGLHAISGVWFDITTDGGESLTPDASASLYFPASNASATIPVAHQVEATGYFERAGNASRIDASRYGVELGRKGTFLLAFESELDGARLRRRPVAQLSIRGDGQSIHLSRYRHCRRHA